MERSKTAIDIFNHHALEYQEKFMDVSLYSDSLDLFCGSVHRENARVLELACGPGNITSYLLEKRPDFRITATDMAPNMLELGKLNNPQAEFTLLDCKNVNRLTEKYDAIVGGFCLPYLSKKDTLKLIADAAAILNTGGIIYLSTMEGDYQNSGIRKPSSGEGPGMYIYFHEAEYLLDGLEKNGFQLIDLSRKQATDQDNSNGEEFEDLILIGKRQ